MSVNHKDRGHSPIGASSSHRWMACPASIRLSEQAPPQGTNKYAEEGTASHELAEMALESKKSCKEFIGEKINGFKVTEEMANNVQFYVDYVKKQAEGSFKELSIEETFELDHIDPEAYGSNDACVYEEYGELEVIDLKYGMFEVEAKDNPQLMYYASGAFRSGDYTSIRLTIVQPRLEREKIKSVVITPERLNQFEQELTEAIARTKDPNAEIKIGKHCRYCPALAICPEKKRKALEVVKSDFDSKPIKDLPSPDALPIATITQILDNADDIRDWLKAVEGYASHEAISEGNIPPSYKLVRKRTRRKLKDEEKFVDDFSDMFGDDIFDKKLKSLTKLEKLLGKKDIEEYVEKPEGDVILVPESDKRIQISLMDAKKQYLEKIGMKPITE